MTKQEILQQIVDFIKKEYEEASHTYLEVYRASRQECKAIHNKVRSIASREKINVKTKTLKCKFD